MAGQIGAGNRALRPRAGALLVHHPLRVGAEVGAPVASDAVVGVPVVGVPVVGAPVYC